MTDDMDETEIATSDPHDRDAEPIDAHFEPLPERDARQARRNGPGWPGVIVASIMAAGLGGAIGVGVNRLAAPPASDTGLARSVDAMQSRTDAALEKLIADQAGLEKRVAQQIAALPQGSETAESLAPLLAELDAVSTRLDEAVVAGGNKEALADLTNRLSALESVDTSGDASSADLARAVAALGQRMDRIESSLQAVATVAPKDEARLERLETGLASLQSGLNAAGTANGADSEKLSSLIEEMRADEAEARAKIEAATTTADATLALSGIESSARQGRSFEVDYRRLRTLLPASAEVRALGEFASDGVPTLAEIKADFKAKRVQAERVIPAKTSGGWGWLESVFGDAVTVRRANGGDSAQDLFETANASLAADDLPAAVEAITRLEGPPAAEMADWTREANRRITLEDALDDARLALTLGEK